MASVKLTEPTARRRVFCDLEPPFPVPIATVTGQAPAPDRWCYFTGELVGSRVVVQHSGDMDVLYRMVRHCNIVILAWHQTGDKPLP